MEIPTLRGRGRPPEDEQIRSLRTRAWYHCCVLETGASNPPALAEMFRVGLSDQQRSWERYASGRSLPSLFRKKPAIVALVAKRFPRTLPVYASPLWISIRQNQIFSVTETDSLLLQLDRKVWGPFFSTDQSGQPARKWSYIQNEIWNAPESILIMDYLAAYLLLLKEARTLGHYLTEHSAEPWIQWALALLPSHPFLGELADELCALVIERMQITVPKKKLPA